MYRLYCEACSYNKYTDGTDVSDLVEYKRSPIMTSIPKFDKKTIPAKFGKLPKQFKCPKCGRLISARKVNWKEKDENIDSGSEDSIK